MGRIDVPIAIGPGSQPAESDGADMDFMQMPSGMITYSAPLIPEPEDIEGLETAVELAQALLGLLRHYRVGEAGGNIELGALDRANREFFDQLLGEGEVSVQCGGRLHASIQESVLAGVWRVQYLDDDQRVIRDTIEVADAPLLVKDLCFSEAAENIDPSLLDIPQTVYNAPPLLTEISARLPGYRPGDEPHVINLSLLPHTNEDIEFLSDALGIGPVVILSRGYGNCRISSTATRNVWWVQYFNSQETLILNTLEICRIPEVACAAQEDIDESAERLEEILTVYR